MRIIKFLALSIFSFLTISLNGQSFKYKALPSEYLQRKRELRNFDSEVQTKLANGYALEKLLPKGYIKDGSQDYTKYLQAGIQKYNVVIFPNFPLLINKNGLTLKSNSTLIFRVNSKLIMQENNLQYYEILRIHNVHNVSVYSPIIIGEREKHYGKDGEWGMGISIKGSSEIKIVNPKVSACWGDGIYIGKVDNKCSKNINIYNARLDNNRRNGVSVTCVDGLLMEKPVISNTSGTNPRSGLDIEPNTNNDIIDNIIINNPVTYNNDVNGIILSLGRLVGSKPQNVNITINNPKDIESLIGMALSLGKFRKQGDIPLSGSIKISNGKWLTNKRKSVQFYKSPFNGLDVNINNTIVTKEGANKLKIIDDKILNNGKF